MAVVMLVLKCVLGDVGDDACGYKLHMRTQCHWHCNYKCISDSTESETMLNKR